MRLNDAEILHLVPDDFNPERTHDLERFKEFGRELQAGGKLVDDKARGVLIEIYCHFHRSRVAATANGRKHPEFEEYALHWLFSDVGRHGRPEYRLLMRSLQCPNSMKIATGESYWFYRRRR